MPSGLQDTHPVSVANLCKILARISSIRQRFDKRLIARRISDFAGDFSTIEIRAKGHAVDSHAIDHIVDVANHIAERRVGILAGVRTQHRDRIVQADQPLALANGIELLVRQIARDRRERMNIGMAGNQRLIADPGDIPEALFRNMGKINENAEAVARP